MLRTIKRLVTYLGDKDSQIAQNFIDTKSYLDLKDLVDSSIIRYERNLNKEVPREDLLSLDKSKMMQLKSLVDEYVSIVEPEYWESNYEESY